MPWPLVSGTRKFGARTTSPATANYKFKSRQLQSQASSSGPGRFVRQHRWARAWGGGWRRWRWRCRWWRCRGPPFLLHARGELLATTHPSSRCASVLRPLLVGRHRLLDGNLQATTGLPTWTLHLSVASSSSGVIGSLMATCKRQTGPAHMDTAPDRGRATCPARAWTSALHLSHASSSSQSCCCS